MFKTIKTILFKFFSIKQYLLLMHYSFFILYYLQILRFFPEYSCHYGVRKLIKKGDTVIDIWANLGHYTALFASWVWDSWHVYAVEPVPIFCEVLRSVFSKKKNVHILPFALGKEDSSCVHLGVTSNDNYMRTWLPKIIEERDLWDNNKFKYIFSSEMRAWSKLFSKLSNINYIKIDVEWYEMPILYDMQDLIMNFHPLLQVESHYKNKFAAFLNSIDYYKDFNNVEWDIICFPKNE